MAPSVPPIATGRHSRSAARATGRSGHRAGWRPPRWLGGALLAIGLVAVACGTPGPADQSLTATVTTIGAVTVETPAAAAGPSSTLTATTAGDDATATTAGTATTGTTTGTIALGQRTLPTRPDGRVVVPQTTPTELRDRRLQADDRLPPPSDGRFVGTVGPVESEVLGRSTWEPGCPVEPDELSYLTVSFWGFDGRAHTGELLVNAEVATDVVEVFRDLYEARFPLEEMRIVTRADLAAAPTGDGNNTTGFVCRAVTAGTSFSQHAYGLAIDLNPFHNPYERGELILPELAVHYLDRSLDQPGMIVAGDVVVDAFARIGWSWGGDWTSLKDYQHFSRNGR